MTPQMAIGQIPSSVTSTYVHHCQLYGATPAGKLGELTYCRFHEQQVSVTDNVDATTGTYSPKPVPKCVETGAELTRLAVIRRDGVPL